MIRRAQGLLLAGLAGALLAASPAAAQERAEVVRVPYPAEDGTLTPYSFEVGYQLVSLLYDTLMWRDAQGVPRPWLADSVERSGREITIRLPRGIRWHDGRALTASDVAFTFEFVRTHPHPRFTPQLRDIELVRVVDDRTVVVNLRRASLGFFDQPLSDLPILPRHVWRNLPAGLLAPLATPVGSGPYMLVDRRPGDSYTFVANRDYFRGRPLVERIEVPIIDTVQGSLRALDRGEVDMIPASLEPGSSAASAGGGVRVGEGDSYSGVVLLFNLRRPPFSDPRARRAVAEALDLNGVASAVGGFGGTAGVLPAESGYLHPASAWAPDRVLHQTDQDAARLAFAELGLGPVTLLAPDNDRLRIRVAEQVVAALARAGADVRLVTLPFRRLAARVGVDRSSSDFELAVWGTYPLASYDPAFLSAIFGSGSPLNYGGYSSDEFERLGTAVASAPTVRARRRAVAAELAHLARDLPVVPILYPQGAFAYSPAAYDGWVYVKGEGILDKRSFLPGELKRAEGDQGPIGDPLDPEGGPGGGDWAWGAVGVVALLAGLGFAWWAATQARRSRR